MAFHIAGSMAFKDAMAKAAPALLEPIMKVEVTMPFLMNRLHGKIHHKYLL